MDIEPITPDAPRSIRLGVMTQRWTDVVFLHWATDPVAADPLLPDAVRLDRHDDQVFVGLVALHMRVAPLGIQPPRLGSFAEVNVRLYSVDRDGRRGLVFASLNADRLAPAAAGRLGYRLPYTWGEFRGSRQVDTVTYAGRRRWPGPAHPTTDFTVRVGERIARPSQLEQFLTARWSLHWSAAGRTWRGDIAHPPWVLHAAYLDSIEDELISAAGLPAPSGEPVSVLWSPGSQVRVGLPRPLRRGAPSRA